LLTPQTSSRRNCATL